MAADATKVSVGKPKKGGAIWRAPYGTALPTDATTALASDFVCLGYASDDGLTNGTSISTEQTKSWGGDIVLNSQTEKQDTFSFKLIEAMNEDVLKTIYGDDNVTVGSTGEIKVAVNGDEQVDATWVVEMILKGGKIKRLVIPNAKITEIGDVVYKDNEPIGYDITIAAVPDTDGNTHYEYIK